MSNGAQIAVRNDGTGDAGLIFINTQNLNLRNQSSISATTNGGNGGNTVIRTNVLTLRDSLINSTAALQGNGGNSTIFAKIVAGDYLSAIRANAALGRGGIVNINTEGFIYADPSTITASSQGGPELNGKVTINVADAFIRQPFQSTRNATALISPRVCEANNNDSVKVLLGSDAVQTGAIIDKLSNFDNIPHIRTNDGHSIPIIPEHGFYMDSSKTYRPIVDIPKSAFSPEAIKNICATVSQNIKKL